MYLKFTMCLNNSYYPELSKLSVIYCIPHSLSLVLKLLPLVKLFAVDKQGADSERRLFI